MKKLQKEAELIYNFLESKVNKTSAIQYIRILLKMSYNQGIVDVLQKQLKKEDK